MQVKSICMVGLGYIGLPTACKFAQSGIHVTGMDTNPRVIDQLTKGEVHIYEPGLRELVNEVVAAGSLSISPSVVDADVFIIAVPTPFHEDKTADMQYVESAAASIVPHLKQGNLVILESTSPPMTTVNIVKPILERSGLKAGHDFHLAYSPERVLPGKILTELVDNARVIGGIDQASAEAGKDLYQHFVKGEIILTDATTAEMVKLMENTSRDINIAIANEFCRLADRFGVDIWEAITIANRHPRVNILRPGIGVGGHCISVDPYYLTHKAQEVGHHPDVILAGRRTNDGMGQYVANEVIRLMVRNGINPVRARVLVLGLTFKENCPDLRNTRVTDIIDELRSYSVEVEVHDPWVSPAQARHEYGISPVAEPAPGSYDAVILAVAHREFVAMGAEGVRALCRPGAVVFDVKRVLPRGCADDCL